MTVPTHTTMGSSTHRILGPDLARGLMLLTIALANVSVYLWGQELDLPSGKPVDGSALDRWLASAMVVFIDGHVYPMFAFLFGYGITQFATSRIARGATSEAVSRMLLRRHLWLLVFGAVHATLLFMGDILGAYALTGLALTPLILRGRDRAIRITLWVSGAVILGGMLLSTLLMFAVGFAIPDDGPFTAILASSDTSDLMALAGQENYFLSALTGFGVWLLSTIGAVVMLTVPCMVLLGSYAARYRWLEGAVVTGPTLSRVAVWGISLGVLGALPAGLQAAGLIQADLFTRFGFAFLASAAGIAGGVGYVALFGHLGTRWRASPGPVVRAVAAVGERSLSSYLLQSLLFAPLLSAWGLGLGERIGVASALGIAVLVWLCSVVLAVGLARRNARGPAEALLRSLTYRSDGTVSRPLSRLFSTVKFEMEG